jgi:hypothetical protein
MQPPSVPKTGVSFTSVAGRYSLKDGGTNLSKPQLLRRECGAEQYHLALTQCLDCRHWNKGRTPEANSSTFMSLRTI